MPLSMSELTIPPLRRALGNLKVLLDKGQAHCESNKVEPSVLVQSRLFLDMRPLSFQVQVATDMTKGCLARLSGREVPSWADDEVDIRQLQARIDRALSLLQEAAAADIDGTEDKEILFKTPNGEIKFTGRDYVQAFVLPNVYFHCTTAYNILRHNGVEIGKFDFLGRA